LRRVLLIRLDRLGDVVLSLYAARALRLRLPQAHVAMAVHPTLAGVVRSCPDIDEVFTYRAPWFRGLESGWPQAIREYFDFVRRVRAEHYDVVVDLRGDARTVCLALATSGARELAGRAPGGAGFLLTRPVDDRVGGHEVESMLDAIGALTGDVSDLLLADRELEPPRLGIGADEIPWAHALLEGPGRDAAGAKPMVAVHPGATWPTKAWQAQGFVEVACALQRGSGARVVLVGDKSAREVTAAIARDVPGSRDLAGATTLSQLAAVLRLAQLVISNDSGPMHLAAALGTPVVGVYCATSPRLWGPLGEKTAVVRPDLPCAPCRRRVCMLDHQASRLCNRVVTPAAVLAAAEALLSSAHTARRLEFACSLDGSYRMAEPARPLAVRPGKCR
jgi:lipopolysaccharide heptosyltransferase II